MANVAFIGDSYTVGVGDGANTYNERTASCGVIQPLTYPNWIDWPAHFEPGIGWPAVKDYGYIPKLMWFLRVKRPNEQHRIVGLSCMNFANSWEAVQHDCGRIINNSSPEPTHTFIFLGLNDGNAMPSISVQDTKDNVKSILDKIENGRKYCIDAMHPSRCPDGVTPIRGSPPGTPPWKDVPPSYPPPDPPPTPEGYDKGTWPGAVCAAHPNQTGYLYMAAAVYLAVEALGEW